MKANPLPFRLIPLALISVLLFSCSKDELPNPFFKGENRISLVADKTPSIMDNDQGELLIHLTLVTAESTSIDLEFELENHLYKSQAIVYLESTTVHIPAGSKTAQLKIKSHDKKILTEMLRAGILLKSSSLNNLKLDQKFSFQIIPHPAFEALTPDQIALLDHYKTMGLDLYPLMGEIPVTTKVSFPGEGNIDYLTQKYERILTGKTIITLSSQATKAKPVLKMTRNAMGIEAYFYELFRNLTVLNTQIWANPDAAYAPPGPRNIMQLIQLSAHSSEQFELGLDGIEISLADQSVQYLGESRDLQEDPFPAIAFEYRYSAWDRLKTLLDQGNPFATENYLEGGSVYPGHYLNSASATEDEYHNSTWFPTTALFGSNSLQFDFIIDHMDAGGYIRFETTYQF